MARSLYSVNGSDGNSYGPVEMDVLKVWCAEGRIDLNTTILDMMTGQLMRAADIPELGPILRTVPGGMGQGAFPQPTQIVQNPGAPMGGQTYQGQYGVVHTSQYGRGSYSLAAPRKSKTVAIVLALIVGVFGGHRFYLGYYGSGLAMLILAILCFVPSLVWAIIDVALIATGGLRDPQGNELV